MNKVTKTISNDDSWTDPIRPDQANHHSQFGHLAMSIVDFSVKSTTVTLQRSFDGGINFKDVDVFTGNMEETIFDPTSGILYRIGVASNHYDGDVVVGLYQDAG